MEAIVQWIDERVAKATSIKELNSIWRVWVLFTERTKDYIFDEVVRKYGKEKLRQV